MSKRYPVEGISHGDKVKLTGESWSHGGFRLDEVYEVDDESFHRPAIYAATAGLAVTHWYIMEPIRDYGDWSVTKVET